MKEVLERAYKAREILHQAVMEELDRKRRLGQYAVMYKDGKVVHVPPEELPELPEQPPKLKD